MPRHSRKYSFGISIEPTWNIQHCLKLAILAEKLDFSTAWVPDGGPAAPYSDSLVTLSALASDTRKIRLGSAIVNFYTRNPAWIASSFATLSDLASRGRAGAPQRMIVGLGTGSPYNVAKFGITSRSGTVDYLREAVESIRELFDGKQVTIRTDPFTIDGVALSKVKKKIPIHIGAQGPKSLRLAGEIADGVILTDRIAADLEDSMKPIELGIGDSSRKRSELEITNSVVISVDANREKAMAAARPTCAYLVAWLSDAKAESLGIDLNSKHKISEFIDKEDESSAGKLVDEKMLLALTISGKPQECVEKCREHLSYGIDQIAFCEPFGPDPVKSISLIAKHVVPKL